MDLRIFSFGRVRFALLSILCMVLISACSPLNMGQFSGSGPRLDGTKRVQVAILLPISAGDKRVRDLAASADRAARMAMKDLENSVEMDLRLYDTAGLETQAAEMARLAVDEGAKVIVGPLFGGAANAAGLAIAGRNVNILSLSNNTDIAGGNVYVLGHTFQNTADRLVSYAFTQGKNRALVVHANNLQGLAGSAAISQALNKEGVVAVGVESYEFTQQDVVDAMSQVATRNTEVEADIVFLTADYDGALPLIAQLLPEAGVDPRIVKYAGLSRWDALPSAFNLPGIQGGWFVMPSANRIRLFKQRYQAVYGSAPHPLAAIAYDSVAAVGASVATGSRDALSASGLTRQNGFQGAAGIFRLKADGTNERGLSVVKIEGNKIVLLDPAPHSFGQFGF